MLSRFFLKRPVFAWVIAIIMMVLGGLAIHNLPISQYPPIAPPSIAIDSFYPGASAETVENSVTQIIEQKMTGFDDMIYMSATSDSAGASRVELTFKPGTDPDIAWAKVQNKLQLAMASLPEVVQRTGVMVSKSTRNFLIIVGLISEDGSMDGNDLRDYAQSNLEKVLARVPGVGEVMTFGSQYAMRIWLNPEKLTDYSLTVEDVILALRAYNVEVSAGQFGGAPAVPGQRLNVSIIVQNLLKTPEEFASIPLRTNPDGSVVRISDIGRTELGTEAYDIQAFHNGRPTAALAIRQAPGANALATADAIKKKMEEMSRYFPKGMKVIYPYDTTPFVKVAINEVVKTLFEAVLLVFLVMWLFMGNIRATLIPTIAVPVVLLGTFAVLGAFGFSINMLTMFAMVLAIGLLVDDAIVVVENVERIMTDEGLPPMEAAAKSMDQITSALIGIGLVLAAVFGPMAFFGGSTGVIYRQFSITIASAMLLSVLVALILTPVLCATMLKPVPKGHEPSENAIWFLRPFFRWFDRVFFSVRAASVKLVGHALTRRLRYIAVFIVIVAGLGFLFMRMPTSFLPDEDQGIMFVQIIMPTGATLEQTQQVANDVQRHFLENEKAAVESCLTISGMGFAGRGQNNGMVFVKMKDWKLRDRPDLRVRAVAGRAMMAFARRRDAMIFAFPPPPVVELGNARGVDFQLVDRGGLGHEALMAARNMLLGMASQDRRLVNVRPNGMEDVPEFRVDVDWEKAGALGLAISSIHNSISAAFGSAYVNNFIQAGRVKRVYVQADAPFRRLPSDLEKIYVRNKTGKMVPFSSFASTRWTMGSPRLERFNGFPSMNIWAEPAPGRSSGEAMRAMEEIVAKLPQGIGYDYAGVSYQERMASAQTAPLYAFSVLVIFLCLAALYESWPIPIAILLVLPLGALGSVIASSLRWLPNDVYFQIGLLTTLGLTTKNAILIVQFAKARVEQGLGLIEATLEGVRLRFRPIVMTSLAFGFGVLPLALATGAGAGAMNAIGTSVLGGMLAGTVLVIIFAPLFYVVIEKAFGKSNRNPAPASGTAGQGHLTGLILPLMAGIALLGSGCSMAPKYTRPAAPIPAQWPTGAAYEQAAATNNSPIAPDLPWREFFTDQKLQQIISMALTNNRDLRLATLNVEMARARYGIQRDQLYPAVDAVAGAAKQRTAADLTRPGQPRTTERYEVNLGVLSWEIDFFGRIRSLKDRALQEYLASEQGRRSAQTLLISTIANAYLALAADREALALARNTFDTQKAAYDLVQRQYTLGIATELDLRQAQTPVEAARRDVSVYTQRVAQDINALNLLAGATVPDDLLPPDLAGVSPPKDVAPGLPSDVLLRRPDVLQAEAMLKAANADIGAARAAFFPRISLTTTLGTASDDLSNLFKSGNGTWSYAPQLVMPIFDARTWSALKASKVQQKMAVASYERAIQNAFREVADALAVRGTVGEQLAAQQALVNALTEAYRLASARFEKGIASYLAVLDAQRSLFAAQQGLVTLRLADQASRIRLYSTLGGGWDDNSSPGNSAARR